MPKRSKDRMVPTQRINAMEVLVDFPSGDGKDKAAQCLGQRGGWKEIAQRAAATRWKT